MKRCRFAGRGIGRDDRARHDAGYPEGREPAPPWRATRALISRVLRTCICSVRRSAGCRRTSYRRRLREKRSSAAPSSISEIGVGPRFREAVRLGTIELRDSTCPAIHAGLQAGEKGQPFTVTARLERLRPIKCGKTGRVIDNPLGDGAILSCCCGDQSGRFSVPCGLCRTDLVMFGSPVAETLALHRPCIETHARDGGKK